MHYLSIGTLGALGALVGIDVLLRVPSLWGYSAIISGWVLLLLASIQAPATRRLEKITGQKSFLVAVKGKHEKP